MRYVAAYLLSVLGGKVAPTATDIDKILSSVGIESDAERVEKVLSSLKGKSIETLLADGRLKLSSMPSAGASAAASTAAAPVAAPEEKKASKKEEKKEESESEDEDLGFGLFD